MEVTPWEFQTRGKNNSKDQERGVVEKNAFKKRGKAPAGCLGRDSRGARHGCRVREKEATSKRVMETPV